MTASGITGPVQRASGSSTVPTFAQYANGSAVPGAAETEACGGGGSGAAVSAAADAATGRTSTAGASAGVAHPGSHPMTSKTEPIFI